MPKPRSSDAKLARLRALRSEPTSPHRLAELRGFLHDASNFIVAEAAETAGAGSRTAIELPPRLPWGALAIQRYDPRIRERVAAAVAKNASRELLALFTERFQT